MAEPFEWIQARHIMEHFISEGCVEIGQPHREAKESLRAQGFDYGVVQRKGRVVGVVACESLRDSTTPVRLAPPIRKPELGILIPDTTPLRQVVRYLGKNSFQLVLQGKEFIGLISVSDLNKHLVFSHLYSLLSHFEQRLIALVNKEFKSEAQWGRLVNSKHLREARGHFRKAQAANVQLDLVHYLYFSDYLDIVGSREAFLTICGFRHPSEWTKWQKNLVALRNDVAHPTGDLVGPRRGASELALIQERLYEQIERAESLLGFNRKGNLSQSLPI